MNTLIESLSNGVPTSMKDTAYDSIIQTFLTYLDGKIGENLDSLQNIRNCQSKKKELLLGNLKLSGFSPKCLSRISENKLETILEFLPKLRAIKGGGGICIFNTDKFRDKYKSPNHNNWIVSESVLNRETSLL